MNFEQIKKLHRQKIPLESVCKPDDIDFSLREGEGSPPRLLLKCLEELPYDYFSSFITAKDFLNVVKRASTHLVDVPHKNIIQFLTQSFDKFNHEEEVKSFFSSIEYREHIVQNFFELISYSGKKRGLKKVLEKMSPLMGMKSWDEPLRYFFKERHSRGVDFWACSEMVVTLSKLEPEISNVFLDVIDGDKRYFSFTKEEVLQPYIFKIFMDLINEKTLPQIIHLLNKNLSGKSEKEIQEFLVMSSDQFIKLKPEELSQLFEGVPQIQKAKDFFIQHQNGPVPQTVFNVWDSQDSMVNLIEKSLQFEAFFKKFSLRDMAVVKSLLNDFISTKGIVLDVFDMSLLNNLNRHMTLFDVLGIENESFSEKVEEKWNQVIDFFCQDFGGEDFNKEAGDIVKFAEKRKLEQMFPEENNARKTVKVKL